jgi:hypothetical protein
MVMVLSASLMGLGALTGCEREISSETKVKDGVGSTKIEEKKTVEKADGTIEQRTEKKTIDK